MAFKKVEPKVESEVVNPKFKSERELVQFLKNSLDLTPAEKQKLLDDFRKK
jgi:hypothetical protein